MTALEHIESFDPTKDIPEFLSHVRDGYDEHYGRWFQEVNDDPMGSGRREITVDLRTGGWSENEAIVDALLANSVISMLYYHSWERGGKHVFKFYQLKS